MADDQNQNEGMLVRTAKKIGAAAGRIASVAPDISVAADQQDDGVREHAAPLRKAAAKKGKLQKKNKAREPRRVKKARVKRENSTGITP